MEKDKSNSASARLSWKVTLSVVTCAPDIDVTVSARSPICGSCGQLPFLAVVRTLDQISTRDEKGNKVEWLSRAMSRGERLKLLGSCNHARSEGVYYEEHQWKRRKVQLSPGIISGSAVLKEGPEIGVLGEGMVGQEAVPQLSSVPRPPGFSFSRVLVTVDRPLRAPGGDSRMETPEYTPILSCQVREPIEGGVRALQDLGQS